MQQQLQQLESEIARLQIELRQVRQLISSLINMENETTHMMYQHIANQQQNPLAGQFVNDQLAQTQQYEQMQQMADRMHNTLYSFSQAITPGSYQYPGRTRMQPAHNDPMQAQF